MRDEGEALEDAAAVAVPRGERDDERHQLARQLLKRASAACLHPAYAPEAAYSQPGGSMRSEPSVILRAKVTSGGSGGTPKSSSSPAPAYGDLAGWRRAC